MPELAGAIETALHALLIEQGVGERAAAQLSAELVREYPLVRRAGLESSRRRLCRTGMTPEAAADTALVLLAFELLGRGAYEQVLQTIAAHAPGDDALAVCIRAARLRREAAPRVEHDAPAALAARLSRIATSFFGSR